MGNVVETMLATALLQIEFMKGVRDEFIRTKGVNFDPKKYEHDFDRYQKEQFSQTMGALKKRLDRLSGFDEKLKKRISDATDRRNFLVHHYWRESSTRFLTESGRRDCADHPRTTVKCGSRHLAYPVDPPRAFVSRRAALETPENDCESMATDRYNAREAEARWQKIWDERGIFATPNGPESPSPRGNDDGRRAEVLRARNVPLSVGAHPYGPRAQLHHGRRGGAGEAGDGLCRAASDGLGRLRHAGRERRHGAQGPSQDVDLRQYRGDEDAAQIDGAVARLEPRNRDLRSGLLQAPAENVPRFSARRSGRAQAVEGELGSGRPDGAGQRAGDRRPRLALRRAGRAARADAMVLRHHQVRRAAARRARHARALAGKSPADAEELDRPLGRPVGPLRARAEHDAERRKRAGSFHHAAGHVVRRQIHGAGAGSSAGRGGREEKSRRSPNSSRNAGAAAPRRPRSTPPRSSASTPGSRRSIRSTRRGSCRSMSRISSSWTTAPAPFSAARRTISATSTSSTNTASAMSPVVCPPGAGSENLRHHRHRL